MSYFLVITFLVALCAIIYVWYVTRSFIIPDDTTLILDGDENKLLSKWYKNNITPSYDFTLTDNEIAAKYLKRFHNIDIDPQLLVIGTELNGSFSELFDIRDSLGESGQIAIVDDKKVRDRLQRVNSCDLSMVNQIMDSDLDKIAANYIKNTLETRWNKILELNDPNLVKKHTGGYVYLNSNNANQALIFSNVVGKATKDGIRLNLLCDNYEFDALIKRWQKSLSQNVLTL